MASKRTLGFSSKALLKKFGSGMTVRNYRDKEVVFAQGDTADAVFYIQNGTVKLTAVSTRRKKATIAGKLFCEGPKLPFASGVRNSRPKK
jgi:CRP/FNR family transcriptional regulator, cyclic AMP receptor protein